MDWLGFPVSYTESNAAASGDYDLWPPGSTSSSPTRYSRLYGEHLFPHLLPFGWVNYRRGFSGLTSISAGAMVKVNDSWKSTAVCGRNKFVPGVSAVLVKFIYTNRDSTLHASGRFVRSHDGLRTQPSVHTQPRQITRGYCPCGTCLFYLSHPPHRFLRGRRGAQ